MKRLAFPHDSVRAIADYLYLNGIKQDYFENGKPQYHIYLHLKKVSDWLDLAPRLELPTT